MQAMHIDGTRFLGFDLDVNGAGDRVYDRRAGDADFRRDVGSADVAVWNRGDSSGGIDKTGLPERRGICA